MMTATTNVTPPEDIYDPNSVAYKKARRKHWKSTRNRPPQVDSDWTPFRAAEKKYKARFPPPDLSDVLDLAVADLARAEEVTRGGWKGRPDAVQLSEIPLRNTKERDHGGQRAYIFPDTPGARFPVGTSANWLVFLPSFLSPDEQRRLVRWALCDQAKSPNETNLDTHYVLPKNGLWNQYLSLCNGEIDEDTEVIPRATLQASATSSESSSDPAQAVRAEPPGPRKLIANEAASPNNYVELLQSPKPPAPPSQTLRPTPTSSLIPKLRWVNIGWYYHWGTKQYDFSRGSGEIARPVRDACRSAVERIPWEMVFGTDEIKEDGMAWGEQGPDWKDWHEKYEPDAGIINFYRTKDTLMAHVDRSELCATSPLVSISLGCAAVFLIGGLTRDDPPTPILLRSGDIVVMSGPACRRAYHGVPRILEGTLPSHLENHPQSGHEDDAWKIYEEYLRGTRINVNVRQVFPKGFDPLCTPSDGSRDDAASQSRI